MERKYGVPMIMKEKPENRVCPSCGLNLALDCVTCPKCGYRESAGAVLPAEDRSGLTGTAAGIGAGVSTKAAPAFCSSCGARLEPGSRFCSACGSRVG